MKKKALYTVLWVVVINSFFCSLHCSHAFAGTWLKGIVTKAPWISKKTYIRIDDKRYIILKRVKTIYVHTRNGAHYKHRMTIKSIRQGDVLLLKVEGNRIYQIEKI